MITAFHRRRFLTRGVSCTTSSEIYVNTKIIFNLFVLLPIKISLLCCVWNGKERTINSQLKITYQNIFISWVKMDSSVLMLSRLNWQSLLPDLFILIILTKDVVDPYGTIDHFKYPHEKFPIVWQERYREDPHSVSCHPAVWPSRQVSVLIADYYILRITYQGVKNVIIFCYVGRYIYL